MPRDAQISSAVAILLTSFRVRHGREDRWSLVARQKSMSNKKTEKKKIDATKITSFADLKGRLEKPVSCYFKLDGELLELPLRRVPPKLAESIRTMRRNVVPPFRKDRNPPNGDYDPMDPEYLRKRDEVEGRVRSLIVYTCCPYLAQEKPGLTSPEEIDAFVKSVWTENILDLIMITAQAGGMNLEEEVQRRANFTFTPGSES